ncbi:50S ribosomal protein L3, partial [Halorubrum sp. SD626R]|uniref:50S ribosomal protein L3 n=1 Tax=Halorubrum sp. SD626R TaxID=1419722 RepID=UPI001F53EF8E
AGYKAGMTHVVMVNDEANSPREGMEESVPVTVVETPPMYAVALRAYEETPYGQKPVEEVWATEFHEELDRALDLPAEDTFEEDADALRELLDDDVIDDVRVITHTAPSELSNVPKKKPDVMETRVGGGSLEERVDFGLDLVAEGGAHEFGDVDAREVAGGAGRLLARDDQNGLRLTVLAPAGLPAAGPNGTALLRALDIGVDADRFEDAEGLLGLFEVLELVAHDEREVEV